VCVCVCVRVRACACVRVCAHAKHNLWVPIKYSIVHRAQHPYCGRGTI